MATTTKQYYKKTNEIELKIKNKIFDGEIIKQIGLKGFMILSYLLYESKGSTDVRTNICMISKFTDTKTPITIVSYLKKLEEANLITLTSDKEVIGKNTMVYVNLNKYYELSGGYEKIPSYLYIDNYKQLNEYSWSIFCLLAKRYYASYNSTAISKQDMMKMLGATKRDKVNEAVKSLIDLDMIYIKQKPIHYVNVEGVRYSKNKLGSTKTKYGISYIKPKDSDNPQG